MSPPATKRRLFQPPRRSILIAMIVASAMFMENLDATVIVTALPQIAHSFGVTAVRMSLGVTAYILATAACIPASGWLADRLGSRTVFGSAIGLFTLASVLCGLAPNFALFIAARSMQGAAAALMSPVGRLVVLRTAEKRDLMQALSTLVWPALFAPVLGPPLGGFITSIASWRWIFYLNLPIGLLGMGWVWTFIPNQKSDHRVPFDGWGFALMAAALTCLTYGIELLSSMRLKMALLLLAGAALIGTLAIRRARTALHPIVRLQALRIRSFWVAAVAGGAVSRATISATPFLLPLLFELGFGLSPVTAGLLLLIYMAANLLMKSVTNPILRAFGIRRVLVFNCLIASLAVAACASISPSLSWPVSGLILFLAGASRSMQFTAITFVTFADIPAEERAAATVLSSLTQQVSMGMGVAVGALLLNFSRILRGATQLSLHDFQTAFLLTGVLGTLAALSYRSLGVDTGAEMTGHRAA